MREAYIARMARRYRLDPAAVLAIASHEGLSGGVGDGGHAFGPFQMNDAGGVLTNHPAAHHSNAWAWSNQGINYALRNMSRVAAGLTGKQAITAIATRYERPADPGAEIRDAMGAYGKYSRGGIQSTPGPRQPAVNRYGAPHGAQGARAAMLGAMMQANQQYAQTGQFDPSAVTTAMIEAKAATLPSRGAMGAAQPGGASNPAAHSVVQLAKKQLGQPYKWGGESRNEGGFDCSGLIQWAYAQKGIRIPRTTGEQIKVGKPVSWGHFRPGDLIFTNGGEHVVMYIGNGQVIAAPHTGTVVQIQNINAHRDSFVAARRIA